MKPGPIRPSAAIESRYQAKLQKQVAAMHADVLATIQRTWRRRKPATTIQAEDESPSAALQAAMDELARKWLSRFDVLAREMAQHFAKSTYQRVDGAMTDMLRRGGMTVRFKMTAAMRDAFNAVRDENVNLIKSIPQKYLGDVNVLMNQSVSQGGGLGDLTKKLEQTYGVSHRRAATIARDQTTKANAAMSKARHLECGITQAKWLHSRGGKTPRPEHVKFSGKVFDLATGHDFGDGEGATWPGVPINCRCTFVPIIPGF